MTMSRSGRDTSRPEKLCFTDLEESPEGSESPSMAAVRGGKGMKVVATSTASHHRCRRSYAAMVSFMVDAQQTPSARLPGAPPASPGRGQGNDAAA